MCAGCARARFPAMNPQHHQSGTEVLHFCHPRNVPHRVTVPSSYRTGASVPFRETRSPRRIPSHVPTFRWRGSPRMASAYAVWLNQPVVLQITAGELQVPLRGTIVGESAEAVRIRIGEGWDVDIYKAMILAVEE